MAMSGRFSYCTVDNTTCSPVNGGLRTGEAALAATGNIKRCSRRLADNGNVLVGEIEPPKWDVAQQVSTSGLERTTRGTFLAFKQENAMDTP